jgi:DNA-binding transcriptional regulator YiaG
MVMFTVTATTPAEALRLGLASVGMSQADAARILDVHPSLVSHWCTGRCMPSPTVRERLVHIIGADVFKGLR